MPDIDNEREEVERLRKQIEPLARKVDLNTEEQETLNGLLRELRWKEDARREHREEAYTVAQVIKALDTFDPDLPVARGRGPIDWLFQIDEGKDDLGPRVVIY